jgi:beta-fructofuranosidase
MWECPDLFELDGYDVLITSPQFMEAEGLEFHNGNGTMCIIGKVDANHKLIRSKIHAVDYGLDFYAPQTLEATDGRRIMIGWMQSWDNHITPEEFEWSGVMSIPRVLTLKNHRLYQYPVSEIEAYRNNKFNKKQTMIAGESYMQLVKGRQIDLILKLKKVACSCFEIKLACGGNKYTQITYEPMKEIITFDRSYSGLHKDVQCIRKMKVDPFHEEMEIRILMDKYTIEMFVDGGKYVMSSLVYTDLSSDHIDFATDGQVDLVIEKYDICV